MDTITATILVITPLAIPVALVWAVSFLLFRRQRALRILFTVAVCVGVIAIRLELVLLAPVLLPVGIATIILFEWGVHKARS